MVLIFFLFSSRRRHTRCALVTGVQTCALPILFAVRLDTFEAEPQSTTFYIGCNDPAELGKLRRLILTDCASLPIAGEYIHRDAFDLADRYGKDQFVTIERLGTARQIGRAHV